ncbi:hypothetical protein B0H11DRAFT_1928737 [Mycena galericulata]|nr:hypothetical protein B0H11DRAFT_1928737 [Mycena galericulata]
MANPKVTATTRHYPGHSQRTSTPSTTTRRRQRLRIPPIRRSCSTTTPSAGKVNAPANPRVKPAFRARWSLPSLDTLAKMIVVPPKAFNLFILVTIAHRRQVRRDHVGAGLPAEPWDIEHTVPSTFLDLSDEDDEEPTKDEPLPLPPPPVPSKSPVP